MAKLTIKLAEEKLKDASGNVSLAAKNLNVTREYLHAYVNKNPHLKEVIQQARESMCDDAENALHALILEKNVQAITFCLKTVGKKRGYVEETSTKNFNMDLSRLSDAQFKVFDELTEAGLDPIAAYAACLAEK